MYRMDQNNDASCSHGFKSENRQKKSVVSVSDDKQIVGPQADGTTNVQQEPIQHFQDVPSIVTVSDKLRLQPENEDAINRNKLQKTYDDTIKYNDMFSVVHIIDKVIDGIHDVNTCNSKIMMEHKTIKPQDKNIRLNSVKKVYTALDDDDKTIDNQETLKKIVEGSAFKIPEKQVDDQVDMESDKGVPSNIDLSDKETVESPISNERNDRQDLSKGGNAAFHSFIDKRIVEPQTEDKICAYDTLTLDKKSNDELENQNLKPCANDIINTHQSQSLEARNIYNSESSEVMLTPKVLSVKSSLLNKEIIRTHQKLQHLGQKPSMVVRSTATQLQILTNLPSPMSINISPNQPQSLFLLALSKLNESAISFAVNSRLDSSMNRTMTLSNRAVSPELTPPASLGNAPPSYSFVLRQMAVRRRPRIFGTFVPSPSFIQQTPPPAYTASFDIYLDNLPPPPSRVYNFGFAPMLVVCPDCGYTGMTQITTKVTLCTHLCAISLCIMCCWLCAPLPYVMRSCKDVYHYCRNCRIFLGTYCPTNPANVTIQ